MPSRSALLVCVLVTAFALPVQARPRSTHRPKVSLRDLGQRVREGACSIGQGVTQACRWARQHPRQAIGIGAGAAAMFAVVFVAAPAVSASVASWLAPVLGKTAAGIVGTGAGGAVACGSRSLLVHSTPMVTGVDPWNGRQLAADVGMSCGFGFVGFGQAAALKGLTTAVGAGGLPLFALNAVGLVGYELGKDFIQNRARSRVANDPKPFRQIWRKALLMELATNLHRCIPGLGLETSFSAKIAGDLGGTIWWDRIINKRNKTSAAAARGALTE
jgi:hypothetical protein